jgi:dsRNA-specific ribonuclease
MAEEKRFSEFIANIFRTYSKLNSSTIARIVDDEENLNTFITAVTHKTYDEKNNYEFLEFYGDNFVNTAITEYIHKRFPNITSEGQFTQIKHNLIKDRTFSNFANRLGLINHVRGDMDYIFGTGESEMGEPVEGNHVLKVQEDLFEAFIGATVTVLDKIHPHSGYTIVYTIIDALLKDMRIETRVERIKHPKMEMNDLVGGEMVKDKFGYKTMLEYRIVDRRERKHVIQAILHYGGERVCTYEGGDSIILGTGEAVNKKSAETEAAKEALIRLKHILG